LPIIPFSWLPASWGLRGKPREVAEANYLLRGEELENKLAEIKYDDDPFALVKEKIHIRYKFHHIDEYERDIELAKETFKPESTELLLALVDVDEAHGKITKAIADKSRADISKEPWVDIIDSGFNPEEGAGGLYFEFNWNDHFITMLREEGYEGLNEDHIVNLWFADLARETINETESNIVQMNVGRDFLKRV
jgi:hypothetical protein